jgi:hypothetical protein
MNKIAIASNGKVLTAHTTIEQARDFVFNEWIRTNPFEDWQECGNNIWRKITKLGFDEIFILEIPFNPLDSLSEKYNALRKPLEKLTWKWRLRKYELR